MRKPRDYDAELKALNDKAKQLRDRKVMQLGELMIATGADRLEMELLAGALLIAAEPKDAQTMEAWRRRGAAFFQGSPRPRPNTRSDAGSATQSTGSAPSSSGQDRAE